MGLGEVPQHRAAVRLQLKCVQVVQVPELGVHKTTLIL